MTFSPRFRLPSDVGHVESKPEVLKKCFTVHTFSARRKMTQLREFQQPSVTADKPRATTSPVVL